MSRKIIVWLAEPVGAVSPPQARLRLVKSEWGGLANLSSEIWSPISDNFLDCMVLSVTRETPSGGNHTTTSYVDIVPINWNSLSELGKKLIRTRTLQYVRRSQAMGNASKSKSNYLIIFKFHPNI